MSAPIARQAKDTDYIETSGGGLGPDTLVIDFADCVGQHWACRSTAMNVSIQEVDGERFAAIALFREDCAGKQALYVAHDAVRCRHIAYALLRAATMLDDGAGRQ